PAAPCWRNRRVTAARGGLVALRLLAGQALQARVDLALRGEEAAEKVWIAGGELAECGSRLALLASAEAGEDTRDEQMGRGVLTRLGNIDGGEKLACFGGRAGACLGLGHDGHH